MLIFVALLCHASSSSSASPAADGNSLEGGGAGNGGGGDEQTPAAASPHHPTSALQRPSALELAKQTSLAPSLAEPPPTYEEAEGIT